MSVSQSVSPQPKIKVVPKNKIKRLRLWVLSRTLGVQSYMYERCHGLKKKKKKNPTRQRLCASSIPLCARTGTYISHQGAYVASINYPFISISLINQNPNHLSYIPLPSNTMTPPPGPPMYIRRNTVSIAGKRHLWRLLFRLFNDCFTYLPQPQTFKFREGGGMKTEMMTKMQTLAPINPTTKKLHQKRRILFLLLILE